MRKLLLILSLLCCMLTSASAQDVRALFMDAPDEVLPLLPRNARADCIDLVDAGMVYPVSNLLGGKSALVRLTDDYLLLQSTGVSAVEMKMLPYGDSFIICVVNSVSAEAKSSRVDFYYHNWKKLDTLSFFTAPSINDFLVGADEKVLDICDMYLVSLALAEDENTLVAEYTMPDYMNSGDAEKVRPFLRRIVYRWNGTAFVIE